MNNTIGKLLIFSAGVAVGALSIWKFVENKYSRLAKEEIDSVKATFGRRKESMEKNIDTLSDLTSAAMRELSRVASDGKKEYEVEYHDYSKILGEHHYVPVKNEEEVNEPVNKDAPYVITPEEFSRGCDYDSVSLTYYSDGTLVDEWDNIVEDIDLTVGEDSLTHFGEYEDDSVFVRNDLLQTDYEILLDTAPYYDKSEDK